MKSSDEKAKKTISASGSSKRRLSTNELVQFDLKWAQTLDGQLCDDSGSSQWISGPEELRETHRLRRLYDAVLVGATTFIRDLAKLTVREYRLADHERQPVRIILDPRGRLAQHLDLEKANGRDLKLQEQLLSNELRPTLILAPQSAKLKRFLDYYSSSPLFHTEFAECFESTDFSGRLNQAIEASEQNFNLQLRQVLVEGGAKVIQSLIDHNLFRQILVTVSPKITGGVKNRVFLKRNLNQAFELSMVGLEIFGNDILVRFESLVTKHQSLHDLRSQDSHGMLSASQNEKSVAGGLDASF